MEDERTSEAEVAMSSEPLDKTAAARVVQGALEEMGISPEEQIQLARAIVELAKKTSPQEANPFLSSETATSAALGILLVATTAIAASQQKDFAAKIPIMSGLFGFVQDPLARLIRAFRSEQSLRLDRTMYTKIIGTGITSSQPGSYQGLQLVVTDIIAARDELVAKGVAVSEVFHDATGIFHHAGTAGRVNGPDPERGSYGSFVSFEDPDGNGWIVQEVTQKAPGR